MKTWFWFLLAASIVLFDQWTKHLAVLYLPPYEPLSVIPMLHLTLAFNSGAAFSFLHGVGAWSRWFFVGVSSTMSLVFIIMLLRTASDNTRLLLALSFMLGGALGNWIDRLFYGYVIDFIDVYFKTYHWPVFNIADSFICMGAFLLLFGKEHPAAY